MIPGRAGAKNKSSNVIHNLAASRRFLLARVPKASAQLLGQHTDVRVVEYFFMYPEDLVDFREAFEQFAPAEIVIAGGKYGPIRAPKNGHRARQGFRLGKTGLEAKKLLQVYPAGLARTNLETRGNAR
jgi:hypothetical protein